MFLFLRRSVRVTMRRLSASGERGEMDDATQQRLITLVAAGIAYVISHQVTERYIDIPEQRGIKDDVLEAILKGGTTATSTILASILVRRLFKS